jgi:REP element-mobilizing transposase RayT
MPNHIHIILMIERQEQWQGQKRQGQSPCPKKTTTTTTAATTTMTTTTTTMGDIIGALKSISTKRANLAENKPGRKIWQFRFYDHIIHNEQDYFRIAEYIENNPATWEQDRFYGENIRPL